ncbi:hypothetical protein BCR33DRAFT_722030 [Rhizoclosmatium globosum]|uniref:C2H2-type domain-containing protein n=1 Tax=Rhizoclosmatium globosum TaxID=329046 RepID=A0A1Y2BP75_9FUNG|nr:hypothetical protein BCR33DRAFT_722030 [Rhizoclosmatium globosum]|eukprot:ORY36526.1 hypothetical protein BCR33DRAFT_722030 [Rhizoclosmatium globosum]
MFHHLSDGRERLLPTADETTLGDRTNYWKDVGVDHGAAKNWRAQNSRVVWAVAKALEGPVSLEALAAIEPNDRMTHLAVAADAVLQDAPFIETIEQFPEGYRFYTYLFETKDAYNLRMRGKSGEEIRQILGGKNRSKYAVENGKVLRIDPYLLGHPAGRSYKFRSANELKPHILWLTYASHATQHQPNPVSPSEWNARDVALCKCEACPHYIHRFKTDVYYPLTRPMHLQPNLKPKYDIHSPGAIFREHEQVWVRVIIKFDKDKGERSIKIANPVFVTLIDEAARPHGFQVNMDKSANGTAMYWPCVIIGRAKIADVLLAALLQKISKTRLTDGTQIGKEEVLPLAPMIVQYAVKLLGFSEGDEEEVTFGHVATGSLEPFLARDPRPESNSIVLDPDLLEQDKNFFKDAFQKALTKIADDSTKWSKEGDTAVLFGNELLRIGDLLRIKHDVGTVEENVIMVTGFELANNKITVLGNRWERDDKFCVTMEAQQTRMQTWRMMEDLSVKERSSTFVSVKLEDIAGRMYPIVHPGLKTTSLVAASYWHDWDTIFENDRAMPVSRQVRARTSKISHDDSDIVAFANRRTLSGPKKSMKQIEGPKATIPLPDGRTVKKLATPVSVSNALPKKRVLQIQQKLLSSDDDSEDDVPLESIRKKRKFVVDSPVTLPVSPKVSAKPTSLSKTALKTKNAKSAKPAVKLTLPAHGDCSTPTAASVIEKEIRPQTSNDLSIGPQVDDLANNDSVSDDDRFEVVIPDFDDDLPNDNFGNEPPKRALDNSERESPAKKPKLRSSLSKELVTDIKSDVRSSARLAKQSTQTPSEAVSDALFVCNEEGCTRSYPTQDALSRHLKKRLPCTVSGCEATFHRSQTRLDHLKTHASGSLKKTILPAAASTGTPILSTMIPNSTEAATSKAVDPQLQKNQSSEKSQSTQILTAGSEANDGTIAPKKKVISKVNIMLPVAGLLSMAGEKTDNVVSVTKLLPVPTATEVRTPMTETAPVKRSVLPSQSGNSLQPAPKTSYYKNPVFTIVEKSSSKQPATPSSNRVEVEKQNTMALAGTSTAATIPLQSKPKDTPPRVDDSFRRPVPVRTGSSTDLRISQSGSQSTTSHTSSQELVISDYLHSNRGQNSLAPPTSASEPRRSSSLDSLCPPTHQEILPPPPPVAIPAPASKFNQQKPITHSKEFSNIHPSRMNNMESTGESEKSGAPQINQYQASVNSKTTALYSDLYKPLPRPRPSSVQQTSTNTPATVNQALNGTQSAGRYSSLYTTSPSWASSTASTTNAQTTVPQQPGATPQPVSSRPGVGTTYASVVGQSFGPAANQMAFQPAPVESQSLKNNGQTSAFTLSVPSTHLQARQNPFRPNMPTVQQQKPMPTTSTSKPVIVAAQPLWSQSSSSVTAGTSSFAPTAGPVYSAPSIQLSSSNVAHFSKSSLPQSNSQLQNPPSSSTSTLPTTAAPPTAPKLTAEVTESKSNHPTLAVPSAPRNPPAQPASANGFVCGIEGCSRSYPNETALKKHRDAKKGKCPNCPFEAHRAGTLFDHRVKVHNMKPVINQR